MTLLRTLLTAAGAAALVSCASGAPPATTTSLELNDAMMPPRVRAMLRILSADSMEGRLAASAGYAKAAAFVAAEMQRIGLAPAGDSGYFQRIPVARNPNGRATLLSSFAALDTIPQALRAVDVNVAGIIEGSDPALREEVVLVAAHLDHIGRTGQPGARCTAIGADSICNGADDDASGVVTVLEAARLVATGARPKRTVIFLAFTGEEGGPSGSRWYLDHPIRPLQNTVAQLQVEMVARPDSLAGGAGKAWLTGYERSTMGPMLASSGLSIVADPRPTMNFFRRSDNYRFALAGIPAHTLSSFAPHADYHAAGDEADKSNWDHLAEIARMAGKAVRFLAEGARPEWNPGGKPEPRPVTPPAATPPPAPKP